MSARVGLLALVLSAAACATAGEEVRSHTYPPEFRYLSAETVSGAMFGFIADVDAIDEILRAQAAPNAEERVDIARRLARMETVAATLDGFHPSNHPMIDARMVQFRRDVALARQAVEASPPSYFLAGTVAGSCLHCHGRRS